MRTLKEMQSSDELWGLNVPRPLVTALGNALPAEVGQLGRAEGCQRGTGSVEMQQSQRGADKEVKKQKLGK